MVPGCEWYVLPKGPVCGNHQLHPKKFISLKIYMNMYIHNYIYAPEIERKNVLRREEVLFGSHDFPRSRRDDSSVIPSLEKR